jgi:predicted O-linked N-acetylglucosamine transferase (SPINDLY family)
LKLHGWRSNITMMGNSFISRCGESINANLDMKEWICANEHDYIKKAIYFAKDIDRLN